MRLFIFTILAVSISACSQKKNMATETSAAETVVEEVAAATVSKTRYDNSCFQDRAVTKEVKDQEATMFFVMNMYMFSFENSRWQPCAVPEEFMVEGMKVKVSGEVLEIKPNERRAGTPFNITKLEKM